MYVSLEVLPSIGTVNACLARGFTRYRNNECMSRSRFYLV